MNFPASEPSKAHANTICKSHFMWIPIKHQSTWPRSYQKRIQSTNLSLVNFARSASRLGYLSYLFLRTIRNIQPLCIPSLVSWGQPEKSTGSTHKKTITSFHHSFSFLPPFLQVGVPPFNQRHSPRYYQTHTAFTISCQHLGEIVHDLCSRWSKQMGDLRCGETWQEQWENDTNSQVKTSSKHLWWMIF